MTPFSHYRNPTKDGDDGQRERGKQTNKERLSKCIVRNYCVIVARKLVTWSENWALHERVLELCSRSESWSWSSVSSVDYRIFTRIDVDESFKCRTEYRILKYEHVKKYTLMEWRIKATENWLYIQHLVTCITLFWNSESNMTLVDSRTPGWFPVFLREFGCDVIRRICLVLSRSASSLLR